MEGGDGMQGGGGSSEKKGAQGDAVMEENEKLRQSLFNLNKLFADKFEAVKLNATVEEELQQARLRLADVEARLESTHAQAGELLKLLSGVAEMNALIHTDSEALVERLEGALKCVVEKDAVIEEQEHRLSHVEEHQAGLKKKLEMAEVEADAAKSLNAKLYGQLAEAQQAQADAEIRAQVSVGVAKQEAAETAAALEEAGTKLQAAEAELKILKLAHEELLAMEEDRVDAEDSRGSPPVDMDEWNIKSASDRSNGVQKLKGMLLDFRPPQAKSALENDEIRNLLETVRCICVDKSLADSSMEPSSTHWLSFPEYIYAWFGSRAAGKGNNHQTNAAKSRLSADGECARFLHRLTQLRRKHRELATFYTLLDSCESDEVSYYVHARRVLVGLDRSYQLSIEVSPVIAQRACAVLIMRHAEDAHAEKVKIGMTQSLLSSESILTASGGVDSAALLAGLLAVYKEEKQQLRSMLEILHNAGDNLQNYPAIHKVRAMLHSINPNASDHEVIAIYQRCSIAGDSRRSISGDHVEFGKDVGGVSAETSPTVSFGLMWLVMQRHGFMIVRQRIGLQFQPDVIDGPATALQCSGNAFSTWLIVKPNVRSLVKKAEGSECECERLWAKNAKQLIQGIEDAAKTKQSTMEMDLAFRLKRLLTSTFSAQSMRMDIAFPPVNMVPMVEELNLMAQVVKQRDMLADAAQVPMRSGHAKFKAKPVTHTSAKDSAKARLTATSQAHSLGKSSLGVGTLRPHSAMH
jgi:hypothetical protein